MLSVDRCLDPLLKRPFSLFRKSGSDFQILYRVAGRGTAILKDKKAGDIIKVLGPLGNGFPKLKSKISPILVAGGLGVAPLFSLAERLADKNPIFFLGARNKKELLCTAELKSIGIKSVIATDDGSAGEKGTVVSLLNKFLTSCCLRLISSCLVYACGPRPMLSELSSLAKKFKINAYAAFEENMACGIGACLGCAVKTVNGYKRVCKEGPVFSLDEIIW
ncbi:MAG: dihydroorotate dehydrogenase electron transfer subunit [Nitrospirae bacterium]|nr:dihydroorotate dehydrogenase electron transfer subunit [Nitrospirota bacterium]